MEAGRPAGRGDGQGSGRQSVPFFIVGTGRCGTTLVQSMLAAHPRLHVPPETHFFFAFDPVCMGLGDPIDGDPEPYIARVCAHPWWSTIVGPSDDFAHAVRSGARSSRAIFRWLLRALTPPERRARRLGEKSPHHEKYTARITELFPDAQFVHVRRDPRDVTESLLRMPWWAHRSVYRTARHWAKVYDRAEAARTALGPERHLVLRYEDLVADPEGVTRALCAFLGEPFDPAMLRHHEIDTASYTEAERAYKAGASSAIAASNVGKYRVALSPDAVRTVEATVGGRLAGAGYQPDPATPRPLGWRLAPLAHAVRWKLTGR